MAEAIDALPQQRPFFLLQSSCAEPAAFNPHFHGEQAVGELFLAHLQAEDTYRHLVELGHVLGNVQHDRCLSHRRPAGHDDQITALEPLGDGIEVIEVAGNACHGRSKRSALDFIEGAGEDFSGGR